MADTFKIAAIQTNTGDDWAKNLEDTKSLIEQAADQGADIVFTPENTFFLSGCHGATREHAFEEENHPAVAFFIALSRTLGIELSIGSIPVKAENGKLHNRSYHFSSAGEIIGRYDKIHLFDADIGGDQIYQESQKYAAGEHAVIIKSCYAKIGLSICYDLRFPHLYRDLAKNGAQILSIPAAFTMKTGQMHWETLLRARAIETGCYVVAAAQTGEHPQGRKTWGHSMIISPMGEVLSNAGTDTGIIIHEINLTNVTDARKQLPSLQHDRDYIVSF